MLINEFRCYEAKIEKRLAVKPRTPLAWAISVLRHWGTTAGKISSEQDALSKIGCSYTAEQMDWGWVQGPCTSSWTAWIICILRNRKGLACGTKLRVCNYKQKQMLSSFNEHECLVQRLMHTWLDRINCLWINGFYYYHPKLFKLSW